MKLSKLTNKGSQSGSVRESPVKAAYETADSQLGTYAPLQPPQHSYAGGSAYVPLGEINANSGG